MPNYTWLWCIKRKQVNKQAVKILREKTDLKLACTGALQNNSVVCSGPRLLPVMKLHGSDKLGGIAVNVYKEHLLTLKIFTSAISSCEYKVFMKLFSHSALEGDFFFQSPHSSVPSVLFFPTHLVTFCQ